MEDIQEPPIDIDADRKPRTAKWIKSDSAVRTADLVAGAIAIALVFWWLQYSTSAICCGDYDGYYHIKWARLLWDNMRAGHLRPPGFPWLPLTTLSPREYVDHHLLFHIILIPFTWFRDLQLGAKVAAILFASLAVFSCYWLVVRYEIRYRLLWLLALLACSAPFLYRMNMTKAPPFAIIFLAIGTYLLFEKKFWQLLPLAFVFALTYDMFVLLILAAAIWTVVTGWTEERFEWRPLAWVGLGSVLGLIINPYFPHNLYLFYEHARVKITPADFATKVGQEWYPYDTREFVVNCYVALAAMLTGYLAFDGSDRKRAQRPLYFLIFSTLLLLMTARWKRFAEYFPPFAILFVAFTLESFWRGRAVFTHLPDDVMLDLQPFLDRQETAATAHENRNEETWRIVKIGSVAVLLGMALFANIYRTAKDIRESDPRDYYAKGAAWMRANVPPGEMVFNTDWDDFPRLFYYDQTHVYTSGLDPTYLMDKSPELSRLYDRITTGEEDDPGPLIRDRFGARWIFSDNTKDHDGFYDNALRSGWFDRVYEDGDCSVLHIRDQKTEPPPEEKPGDGDSSDSKDDNSP
ncbi:MAG: hypothetical protein QOH41_365 [Blastocatellia bacterium]|jgi:hypothetical protein|nr:hypothetical protein [Blastocatellia bacterium]